MEKKPSSQHQRLWSAVSCPHPALEAICPPRNLPLPAQKPWSRRLDNLGTNPTRLTNTQRRRLQQKRAKERDDACQKGALQALDSATRTLVLHNLKSIRGRPVGPNDREQQWTSIPRSGDPSGGAAPSGGGLPIRNDHLVRNVSNNSPPSDFFWSHYFC